MKKIKYFYFKLILIVLIFILIGYGISIKCFHSDLIKNTWEEAALPCLINDGDLVRQNFTAGYSKCKSVEVQVATYAGAANKGVLNFKLYDAQDKLISEAKIDIAKLKDCAFQKFDINYELRKGDEYYFTISCDDPEYAPAVLIVNYDDQIDASVPAQKNGMELDHCMSYKITYYAVDVYKVLVVVLLVILIMVLEFWNKKSKYLSWILLAYPICLCYLFELVSGNALFRIQTINLIIGNCIWIYAIWLLIDVFIHNYKRSMQVLLIIVWIYSTANSLIISFRGVPICPWDIISIGTALNVIESYHFQFDFLMLVQWLSFTVLFLITTKIDTVLFETLFYGNKNLKRILFSLFLVAIWCVSFFKFDFYHKLGGYDEFWDYQVGYSRCGYMLSFAKNFGEMFIDKPKSYTDFSADQLKMGEEEKSTDEHILPNIIVIMNESFSDLTVINDFPVSEDVLRNYHEIDENVIKGNLHVSVFGGKTCNTEFEFLTGMSTAFLPSGSIPYNTYIHSSIPNITSVLAEKGYVTTAIHPFAASGWRRDKVYQFLGFDDFLSIKDFDEQEISRVYITDECNYKKIIEVMERDDSRPQFIFNITMQNHGGYGIKYDNFIWDVMAEEMQEDNTASDYLSLVKKSDIALGELIRYFKTFDEPTVILMFGDHLPWLSEEFYEYLYGKPSIDLNKDEQEKKYIVPYILWANYNIEEKDIGDISVNYLGAYLLDIIGIDMPDYYMWLLETSKQYPIVTANGYLKDNKMVDWSMEEDDEAMTIYRNIVYDILFNDQKKTKGLY